MDLCDIAECGHSEQGEMVVDDAVFFFLRMSRV